jgi:hypothetical protein
MSSLKHPIRAIREPFGTAGLIVALIALVAALGGSALAAGGALTGKQKKEVEKIAKKYAGKPGVAGAAGPAGTAGGTGPAGTAGKTGKEGPEGKEGAPWTAGGTLPKGKTEAGAWTITPVPIAALGGALVGQGSFSFGIPLQTPPTMAFVNESHEESVFEAEKEEWGLFGSAANCLGTAKAPTAKSGFLCIYVRENGGHGATLISANAYPSGALLELGGTEENIPKSGTWAVTAKE